MNLSLGKLGLILFCACHWGRGEPSLRTFVIWHWKTRLVYKFWLRNHIIEHLSSRELTIAQKSSWALIWRWGSWLDWFGSFPHRAVIRSINWCVAIITPLFRSTWTYLTLSTWWTFSSQTLINSLNWKTSIFLFNVATVREVVQFLCTTGSCYLL